MPFIQHSPRVFIRSTNLGFSMFPTKKAVTLFVCDKSLQEKKPFTIAKSEKKGFVVTCPEPKCTFRMSFFKQADGHFHQVGEGSTHSCDAVLPTVKRSWLRERARELFQERGRLSEADFEDILWERFGISASAG